MHYYVKWQLDKDEEKKPDDFAVFLCSSPNICTEGQRHEGNYQVDAKYFHNYSVIVQANYRLSPEIVKSKNASVELPSRGTGEFSFR